MPYLNHRPTEADKVRELYLHDPFVSDEAYSRMIDNASEADEIATILRERDSFREDY